MICPLLSFGLGGVSRLVFSFTHASRGRRRGGKVGISRVMRDFQGAVGTGGNLLLVFAGFHSSVFSTALLWVGFHEWPPLPIEAPHHVRPLAQRHASIEMFMDGNRATRQRAAETSLL